MPFRPTTDVLIKSLIYWKGIEFPSKRIKYWVWFGQNPKGALALKLEKGLQTSVIDPPITSSVQRVIVLEVGIMIMNKGSFSFSRALSLKKKVDKTRGTQSSMRFAAKKLRTHSPSR